MQNKIDALGNQLNLLKVIEDSKPIVNQLKESAAYDKVVLSSEDDNELLIDMSAMATKILYDQLGVNRNGMDNKELLLSKEGIIDIIKKIFKSNKKIDLKEAKYNDVKKYVDDNYEDMGTVKIDSSYIKNYLIILKILGYDNVTNLKDMFDKLIEANNYIIDTVGDNNIFEFENMLSTKPLTKFGYSINEKLKLFNNKSIDSIVDIKLNNFVKYDKKNNLKVDEYRFLPLGISGDGYVSLYILRYVKNGDLYTMIPRWDEFKIKSNIKIPDIEFYATPEDYVMIKNLYDNNNIEHYISPSSVFEESYDESSINSKLDKYINSLGNVKYDVDKLYIDKGYKYKYMDFVSEWDLDFNSDMNLVNFIVDISLANFYDNIDQEDFGSLDILKNAVDDVYYDLVYGIAKKLVSTD